MSQNNGDRPSEEITVPQCKICMHPQRRAIDRLIAIGTMPDVEIVRLYNNDFSRHSVARHTKDHLQYEQLAIRRIIERNLEEGRETAEDGISGVIARRVYLDLVLQKGLEALVDGDSLPDIKDVLSAIQVQDNRDSRLSGQSFTEYQAQFNAFVQAIRELSSPELWNQIRERTIEILSESGQEPPSLQAG